MSAASRRISSLRREAAACRACDLWRCGTQTVFGAGNADASLFLIGEQPGDQEDKQGEPFVGPAGRILNEALAAAGIERRDVYLTNAVKHFRFEERGKRRLHKRPGGRHITACKPWLFEELDAVRPKIVVCLGAVAAQSLLGSAFRLTKHRGEFIEREGLPSTLATIHPSAILRADDADRDEMYAGLVADLRSARKVSRSAA